MSPMEPQPGARSWVVILNYQGRDHLADCLESVRRQQQPAGGARVLVVDNGSDDGSTAVVPKRYPEFELVSSAVNLGYAGGNNLGIRRALEAGAEYVALLNMDTRVDPGWLRLLVEKADATPRAALLGARILSADGSMVEFDGDCFDPVTTSGGYADYPVSRRSRPTGPAAYACGAGMLMRASCLAEVGLLDETFFAYHEDVELSLRCWLHGYEVLNVAEAVVHHSVGGAGAGVPFRDFMGTRNLTLTLAKLYDAASWRSHGQALAGNLLRAEDRARAGAVLAALFDMPTALRRRRQHRLGGARGYAELAKRLESWRAGG